MNIVPIYYPGNEKYIEQLGMTSERNSPPWQSSIRPLSDEAYHYIISCSGIENEDEENSYDEIKELLKDSVRKLYRDNNDDAVLEIIEYAEKLKRAIDDRDNSR